MKNKHQTFAAWRSANISDDCLHLANRKAMLHGGIFMVFPDGRILPPYAGSGRSHAAPLPHPRPVRQTHASKRHSHPPAISAG